MTDDDDYSVECNCAWRIARQILTGKDWQLWNLQERYAAIFQPILRAKSPY
jgi:hypothetical protein